MTRASEEEIPFDLVVCLSFSSGDATDEDLRRLATEAVSLLGRPGSHAYAASLLKAIDLELGKRALTWKRLGRSLKTTVDN